MNDPPRYLRAYHVARKKKNGSDDKDEYVRDMFNDGEMILVKVYRGFA